jgi:hypothetical protein
MADDTDRAPLSNARGIRGTCRGDVAVERRRRDSEAVRDLRHADVGIGERRLRGLNVVVCQFRRTSSCAANATRRVLVAISVCSPQSRDDRFHLLAAVPGRRQCIAQPGGDDRAA